QGGGIDASRGGASDPVKISNNLITGNAATDTVKGGGGLYVSVAAPLAPLTLRNNDFNGNTPAGKQTAGARNDTNTIPGSSPPAITANLNVNPGFAAPQSNNY